MSVEENKAIVRRHLIDVLEQGRVELIDGYYAPDGSDPNMDTPQQYRERVLWHHIVAPGYTIKILDMVAEGDKVAVYWQCDLTYSVAADPPLEFPFFPFGKPCSWKIMSIGRVVDGRLVSWASANEWVATLVKEGVYVLADAKAA
jgi:hypothetical protein